MELRGGAYSTAHTPCLCCWAGYKCWGQRVRTGEGLSRWAVAPAELRGPCVPPRKGSRCFRLGRAKFP